VEERVGVRREDAVVAMNHLKRLEGQAASLRDRQRMALQMGELSQEATRSMGVLGPRHVALAVNAAAGRDGGERVLAAAAERMLLMSRDPIRDYVFPEQTVAMVFNGFAHTGLRHAALLQCLSEVIQSRQRPFGNCDNIACVLNALVKTGFRDAALMARLSQDAQQLGHLSPAAAAKMLHAFAATRTHDEPLFKFIAARLTEPARAHGDDGGRRQGMTAWANMPPVVAISMQTSWAGWRGGQEGRTVSDDASASMLATPEGLDGEGGAAHSQTRAHTAQSVAVTMNALAKLRFADRFPPLLLSARPPPLLLARDPTPKGCLVFGAVLCMQAGRRAGCA